jgi:hypothetical protein
VIGSPNQLTGCLCWNQAEDSEIRRCVCESAVLADDEVTDETEVNGLGDLGVQLRQDGQPASHTPSV